MDDCLFCKIGRGELPSRKIYEDEEILAFHDIHPARPTHFLIIPKRHITSLATTSLQDVSILGKMLALTSRLALENNCPDGFRVVINVGRIGGQEVPHLHLHVLGDKKPLGPVITR